MRLAEQLDHNEVQQRRRTERDYGDVSDGIGDQGRGRGGADRADCVRDLELRERQVSKQTACRSVVPLALRTGWTVDADGERR